MGATKDSEPIMDEMGKVVVENGVNGLLISNALEFEDGGISLPQQFESNPLINTAIKEINKLRAAQNKSHLIINFQSPETKTTKMDNAETQSRVLFKELLGTDGITKFEEALDEVKNQLKKENLKKLKFDKETDATIIDQLKSILTDNKELNENQTKFKKAFVYIKELFITKNIETNKILIDTYF